jgi:hypothetical protein
MREPERLFRPQTTVRYRTLHGRMARKTGMLLPGKIAFIKAEIKRLEKARQECIDSGLQKQIDAWIDELKKKLDEKM